MENTEFINKIKDCSGNERKALIKEEQQKQIISMVCRQTDYDEETAKKKILEHNGNFMNVIKEYMDPNFKKREQKKQEIEQSKSTNQKIYGEIRNFMDTASRQYEVRKRKAEIIQERIEAYQKHKAEQESQESASKTQTNDNNKQDP